LRFTGDPATGVIHGRRLLAGAINIEVPRDHQLAIDDSTNEDAPSAAVRKS
jgi:hypothetical protein